MVVFFSGVAKPADYVKSSCLVALQHRLLTRPFPPVLDNSSLLRVQNEKITLLILLDADFCLTNNNNKRILLLYPSPSLQFSLGMNIYGAISKSTHRQR
jgi:hypothetical protein